MKNYSIKGKKMQYPAVCLLTCVPEKRKSGCRIWQCATPASFPLSAEAAIFARSGQKIGKFRRKFLRNFKSLRLRRKDLGLLHLNAISLSEK